MCIQLVYAEVTHIYSIRIQMVYVSVSSVYAGILHDVYALSQ